MFFFIDDKNTQKKHYCFSYNQKLDAEINVVFTAFVQDSD